MLKTLVTIAFILVCVILVGLVMKQESKSEGLTGTMSGMGESYWSKNKGRSKEGNMIKWTAALTVVFLVMTVILNIMA